MGMVVIDDVAEMTKEMWIYLDTVVKGKVMDIVDDLRKDPYEEERQYKREARLELGNMLDKAADEIEQLRNAIKVQANAVRVLHEAETSELNLLRKNAQEAYTAKATLDSEREANKILTDEIERLREELKELSESIGLQRDDAFEHGFGRGEEEGLQIGYKKGYDAAMKEKE